MQTRHNFATRGQSILDAARVPRSYSSGSYEPYRCQVSYVSTDITGADLLPSHAVRGGDGSRRDPTGHAGTVSRSDGRAGYGFISAPSGTIPVSQYRHSAINRRRANATIPMRRVTAPAVPNRRWYHCVSALAG